MTNDSRAIDLRKLKELIAIGIKCIPQDRESNQAVMVIGDTGVGKSTIMSFLNGSELVVRYDGLKPTLDNVSESKIKIGHQKFSETTIPTKVVIGDMAFYDCPGFKDNKGEEYEISNSFFVQRLLDIYKKVKIVLIVDESHISEARADKLPKLVRNLHQAFERFDDIQDGVIMIINRAGKEHTQENYHRQILKMIQLKKDNIFLFQTEEREFLKYLIEKRRVVIFRQAVKDEKDRKFQGTMRENNIMNTIKNCNFVKSRHIKNILSEAAKLSIRQFIDEITIKSNTKIEIICQFLVQEYIKKVQILGRNIDGIISLKDEIMKLGEELKSAKKQNIVNILQREMPKDKIQDFEQDFASIMFFKQIYDKTATYFSNLINKIYAQLSHLLNKLDKKITTIQKENQQEVQKQRQLQQHQIKIQKRQQEKKVAMQHCSKMEQLKTIALTLNKQKKNLIEEIKLAMKNLDLVQEQLKKVKKDANNLKITNKQIDSEFTRVQQTYFSKKVR